MNILLVTTIYEEGGGTKNLIDDMGKKFKDLGHKVDIISVYPRYEKGILFQGPLENITYLNNTVNINILNTIDYFVKLVEQKKPNRLYFFLGHGILLLVVAALRNLYKSRSILFYLDPWFTIPELKEELEKFSSNYKMLRDKVARENVTIFFWEKVRPFELLAGRDSSNAGFYKSVHNILLCTHDMIKYFTEKLKVPRKRIKFLPLYTRSLTINEEKSILQTVNNCEKKNGFQKIIFIGRVSSSWKGFWILLEVLKELKDIELNIYTVSPSEVELAQKLLETYKINYKERVKFFLGKKDKEVFEAMQSSDILILPSLAEGFSFVMVECMGVGGIVVAGPKYGGPLEVIDNGKNGFLFKVGSSRSLISTIKHIRKLNKIELMKIKANAKETAIKYSFDLFWQKLSKGEHF